MSIKRKILKPKYIVLFIMLANVYFLCRTRKCYSFYDTDAGAAQRPFTDSQIKVLMSNNTDARLTVAPINVIMRKSNTLAFHVFSFADFKTFKINSIDVIYDGKTKTFKYDTVYDMDFENPNIAQVITYEIYGTTVQGYRKLTFPGFMNFGPCWANFYDLFKWKHNRLDEEFYVQLIISYNLDDRLYNQKLIYKVACIEDYPPRLFQIFF